METTEKWKDCRLLGAAAEVSGVTPSAIGAVRGCNHPHPRALARRPLTSLVSRAFHFGRLRQGDFHRPVCVVAVAAIRKLGK